MFHFKAKFSELSLTGWVSHVPQPFSLVDTYFFALPLSSSPSLYSLLLSFFHLPPTSSFSPQRSRPHPVISALPVTHIPFRPSYINSETKVALLFSALLMDAVIPQCNARQNWRNNSQLETININCLQEQIYCVPCLQKHPDFSLLSFQVQDLQQQHHSLQRCSLIKAITASLPVSTKLTSIRSFLIH